MLPIITLIFIIALIAILFTFPVIIVIAIKIFIALVLFIFLFESIFVPVLENWRHGKAIKRAEKKKKRKLRRRIWRIRKIQIKKWLNERPIERLLALIPKWSELVKLVLVIWARFFAMARREWPKLVKFILFYLFFLLTYAFIVVTLRSDVSISTLLHSLWQF